MGQFKRIAEVACGGGAAIFRGDFILWVPPGVCHCAPMEVRGRPVNGALRAYRDSRVRRRRGAFGGEFTFGLPPLGVPLCAQVRRLSKTAVAILRP